MEVFTLDVDPLGASMVQNTFLHFNIPSSVVPTQSEPTVVSCPAGLASGAMLTALCIDTCTHGLSIQIRG